MMLVIYNLLQLLISPLALLALPVYLLSRPEKCKAILPKLGVGLKPLEKSNRTVVWFHALSVGEVTSVLPLVRSLREAQETATIVFSVSTVSGFRLASQLLSAHCDRLIYAPLDILPVVRRFVTRMSPDLFILVETDFWPNLLHTLTRSNAALLLVNGRVSKSSARNYIRFRALFRQMLDQFDTLCMQTADDRDRMVSIGIDEGKIAVLGNLKFADQPRTLQPPKSSPFPPDQVVILAGSTHHGEERMLLDSLQLLRADHPSLHLAIAPRNIARSNGIATLAEGYGFTSSRYSSPSHQAADITIIDTIGDLSDLYQFGDICFVGGSLVDEGGHNPLEAARHGRAVLFGPYMADFSEISAELVQAGGAIQVANPAELHETITTLIVSETSRTRLGEKARSFVMCQQHIIADHLRVIIAHL